MYYCRWLSWRKKSKCAREEFLLLLLLSRFLASFLRLTLTQLGNPAFPTPVYGTVAPASGKRDFCISPASLPFSLLAAFQLPSYPTATICRTVLQSITKFSAHCHKSPREDPSICRTMATCTTERLPTWYSSTQVSDVSLEYGHRIRASSFEVTKSLCEGDVNTCPSWGIGLLYSR